jgi:hypothetical protein
MPNQDVTDLQRDGLQSNVSSVNCPKGVGPRHPMRPWRNFDRAMLLCDPDQSKTDNERVRGERQVRKLWEQRTLIVHMRALILRAA